MGLFSERRTYFRSLQPYEDKDFFPIGSVVCFGHYPQKSDGSDASPIEWIVKAREGSRALLVSRYGLDVLPYNVNRSRVTWESCSLRKWLNDGFSRIAFSETEWAYVLSSNIINKRIASQRTSAGNNTVDKVFLLDLSEAESLFSDPKDRMCFLTEYALSRGAMTDKEYQEDGKFAGSWWLRSPGYRQDYVSHLYCDGTVYDRYVDHPGYVIRPALWVALDCVFPIDKP